jgi:hypothetical protein
LYFEPVEEGAVSDKSYPELCVSTDSYQGFGDTYQPKLSKRTTHNLCFQLPTTITFQNKDPYNHHSLPSHELLRMHAACAKILDVTGKART